MSKIKFIETVVELDSGLQIRLSGEYAPIREFLDKLEKDFEEDEDYEDDHTVTDDIETWAEGMLVEAGVDGAGGFGHIEEGDQGVFAGRSHCGGWVDFFSHGLHYFVESEVKRGEIRLA